MRNQKGNVIEETPSAHWADKVADELIQKFPAKDTFVCASGISPSGMVHIGNFREAITGDFVARALKARGKKVRSIYSWDDFDALRKVPANLPQPKLIEENLRRPVGRIPDPFGDCESYAQHFEKKFEAEIAQLGIKPEFIYQSVRYAAGDYAEGVLTAWKHQSDIVDILNKHRTEPLEKEWTCISIFCEKCDGDMTVMRGFEEPQTFNYFCKRCKLEQKADVKKHRGVKLLWRVDWPMRWSKEGVDFEPGGKDHSSQGGSYDTGAEIIRKVWGKEPPHYVQYDFVLAKGIGAKLSSSSGQLITVSEALEIYEPAIIRWIFASRKPNIDFSIAFDLDVMKAYDDFDRCERFAFGVETGDEKKVSYERRIYQLSTISETAVDLTRLAAQFQFRHLCNILQINLGNIEKTKAYYSKLIKDSNDEARFTLRSGRAWKWITTFAPEEFKFSLRKELSEVPKTKFPLAVKELVNYLENQFTGESAEDLVATTIYEIMKKSQVEPKLFFQDVYNILIAKTNGPKLASFLLAMGKNEALRLLSQSL